MRSSPEMRLMSTRWAGRASRKLSRGTSDCPPASTCASSNDASSEQASSTFAGAWYSNCAGFISFQHRDGAAQRGLAALEAPREAAKLDLPIEHLVDLPTQVLDVDDVVREEQRVHDLVVGLREDLVEAAAQLLLRLFSLVRANAADDSVHGMVGAARVDGDPAHAAILHPLRERTGGTGMTDEIAGLVAL